MLKKLFFFYYYKDRFSFFSIVTTLFLASLSLGLYLINRAFLPQKLPIFYSHSWGEDQLASTPQFIILPLVIILITMINMIISWHLHQTQLLLKRIINLTTVLVSILIAVTSLKIILIFI